MRFADDVFFQDFSIHFTLINKLLKLARYHSLLLLVVVFYQLKFKWSSLIFFVSKHILTVFRQCNWAKNLIFQVRV